MPVACELWLDARGQELRARLPDGARVRDAPSGGSTLRLDGEPADVARLIASLGVPFAVVRPDELRDALARLGSLLIASALRGADPQDADQPD